MDIHIVFGRCAKGTLVNSRVFLPNEIKLICLEDILNIGPICDLDDSPQEREEWLVNVYEINTLEERGVRKIVTEDIEKIKTLLESINENNKVFLWTGIDPIDIISTARLLSHFPKSHNNVYIVDYSNIAVKNEYGNTVFPRSLVTTSLEQVKVIAKKFKKMSNEEFIKWNKLWREIKKDTSQLRIIDKKGNIKGKEESYFDSLLESYCTKEFQKPARIIGAVLCDIDFNVGDGYLNWRLKQLVGKKKIEARGELNEMRDYEVKLR